MEKIPKTTEISFRRILEDSKFLMSVRWRIGRAVLLKTRIWFSKVCPLCWAHLDACQSKAGEEDGRVWCGLEVGKVSIPKHDYAPSNFSDLTRVF